ncbi:unnamed protein product, partial [marine sediment metagenome]
LHKRMPDWNDALYYKLIDFGVDAYNFNKDAALNWTEPGTFECMRDAMRYREGRKVKTKKSVRSAPHKTLTARAAKPKRKAVVQKVDDAFKQLDKTGKMDDAVSALAAMRQAQRRA